MFLGRFAALFRALVPGVAGLSGLSYPRFAFANAAGAAVWGTTFTLLGYAAGRSYERVLSAAGTASTALIAAVVVALVGFFIWRRVREHKALVKARAAQLAGLSRELASPLAAHEVGEVPRTDDAEGAGNHDQNDR